MPDTSPDIEFISIDDLLIEEKTHAQPEPPQQMPLPSARAASKPVPPAAVRPKSHIARVRRQTIVQRRRNRHGSESALAAALGVVLIVLAVAAYHYFSPAPSPSAPVPMPIAQPPRMFKVPPQPLPVNAAETLPAPSAPAEGAGARIDEPAPAPAQALDLQASVTAFLSVWGRAWEKTAGPQGALAAYLDCYGAGFAHEGMDKAAWAADKGRKNRRKDWIRIRLSDIRVATPMKDDTVLVTFFQDYASSNYSIAAEKTLLLKKSGPSWQIIGIR